MTEPVQLAAIRPDATDEEVAAVLAALQVSLPSAAGAVDDEVEPERWRFSGRWWTKPVPMRRGRPW